MESLLVVDLLQKAPDRRPRLGQVTILLAVDFFVLQRLHERFASGVVPRAPALAHAEAPAVLPNPANVVMAGVLDSLVGVMHPARLTPVNSHSSCKGIGVAKLTSFSMYG
jgi:hypothetical protein